MSYSKVIRTICVFSEEPRDEDAYKIKSVGKKLEEKGYEIQTKRMVSTMSRIDALQTVASKGIDYTSVGDISYEDAVTLMPRFLKTENLVYNIDLAGVDVERKHVQLLMEIIKTDPSKTFNFAYTFNNVATSPFFPSARYKQDGFAIGMQPTDLAEGCKSLENWLERMKGCWEEIAQVFVDDPSFLGIDSSIVPLSAGDSSFIHFVKRLGYSFDDSVTTDFYTKITKYIKEQNPKPVGLCGLMLPCLEDVELAAEYEKGNFTIERNIFLSLHSGLGIDTYPIGIDERPERIAEVLRLVKALSNKYQKPLSARFVSDGKTAIGGKTDFKHPYLADCIVRPL